jgi:hypothetical protein
MTPTSEIALSPARAPGARPSGRTRGHGGAWERIFAVLGLCLPVPLLALSGLSIPLPAGVERIGAALVSWADLSADGADPLGLGDRGSIVLASGERVAFEAPSGAEADTARRIAALALVETAGGAKDGGTPPKGEGGGGGGGGNGGNGGDGGNGGGSTPPDPGGGDPGDEPGLVEDTVRKVTEEPLVGEVDNTLDELLPTGDDESSGGLVDDALSGLGL